MKMAEAGAALTRHDLEAKIVKRCWENEGFRKEFTGDPAGTAAKYLGGADKLPKIVVHEELAGSWYIVLPSRPANISELSERELEKVAGGGGSYEYTLGLTIVAATVVLSGAGAAGSAVVSAKQGW
jgi:hypothetical protein